MDTLPSYHLVVARYKEDVSWMDLVDNDPAGTIFVYDKSPQPNPAFIPRANRGREVGSFLEHIILHYDDLPEYVIFVQGDPFAHVNDKNRDSLAHHIHEELSRRPQTTIPFLTDWFTERHYYFPSIKSREYFSFLFDSPVPSYMAVAAGCQYIVPRAMILGRPLSLPEDPFHAADG